MKLRRDGWQAGHPTLSCATGKKERYFQQTLNINIITTYEEAVPVFTGDIPKSAFDGITILQVGNRIPTVPGTMFTIPNDVLAWFSKFRNLSEL